MILKIFQYIKIWIFKCNPNGCKYYIPFKYIRFTFRSRYFWNIRKSKGNVCIWILMLLIGSYGMKWGQHSSVWPGIPQQSLSVAEVKGIMSREISISPSCCSSAGSSAFRWIRDESDTTETLSKGKSTCSSWWPGTRTRHCASLWSIVVSWW